LLDRVPPLPLKIPVIKLAKFKLTLLPLFQIKTHFVIKKEKYKIAVNVQPKRLIIFGSVSTAADMQPV